MAPDAGAASPTAEPIAVYRGLRQRGVLHARPGAAAGDRKLQSLYRALLHIGPRPGCAAGWLASVSPKTAAAPRRLGFTCAARSGAAIDADGSVLPLGASTRKRRVHFNAFMLEVHDRIERERQAKTDAPIVEVASDLAAEAALLCFDEFQVDDIADAMILERLFTALFDAGVVVVATSNRAPDELYEHGLQRERFLPFIALLKTKLYVLELDSGHDYRLARMQGMAVYHHPLDRVAHDALEHAFAELTDGASGREHDPHRQGPLARRPRTARSVAWFGFDDLCAKPLAAADYSP